MNQPVNHYSSPISEFSFTVIHQVQQFSSQVNIQTILSAIFEPIWLKNNLKAKQFHLFPLVWKMHCLNESSSYSLCKWTKAELIACLRSTKLSRTWLIQVLFNWLPQGLNCKIEHRASSTAAWGCETLSLWVFDLEKQDYNVTITLSDKLNNIYYLSLTCKVNLQT